MNRRLFSSALAAALILALPSAGRAISIRGTVRNVPYVIGFHPLHSLKSPYLGQMHLNFNNGIVSGTYTDISIDPGGPFANATNIPVSGGVSQSHVTLLIKNVTFRGTVSGEKMSGSATIRGTVYIFAAQQGTPGGK